VIDPPLNWTAKRLAAVGLGANAVTVFGFLVGVGGCVAIGFGLYSLALALIAVNRIADGLDGAIARRTGSSDVGGFLDIVLDTVFYSGVPFAFAVARPEFALPAAFLIYSFVGTGGSFLAFAVIAGKRKLDTRRSGKKSFFYSAGLMEGTETVLFLVLACLLPDDFPVLAWAFGGLCWLTTALRIAAGVREFRDGV
jgi:phosphatidylglycerophosphate synthase